MDNTDKAALIKTSKIPIYQGLFNYFPRGLTEVAVVSRFGSEKHSFDLSDKGFLDERYSIEGYNDAMARHILSLSIEGERNYEDGGLFHRAQIAWNALASLERILIQLEKEK